MIKVVIQLTDIIFLSTFSEFRAQLSRLETLGSQVPPLVISDLLKEEIGRATTAQTMLTETFQSTLDKLAERQVLLFSTYNDTFHLKMCVETYQ